MDWMDFVRTSWPIMLALISLIIVLAKMHSDIEVMKEKIRTLFELWNKRNGKSSQNLISCSIKKSPVLLKDAPLIVPDLKKLGKAPV